jgi:site-specific DNA-methyltransferase (adenine-specific)
MKSIRLLNDDCRDVLSDLPDNCVQLVLADIPYGVVNRTSNGLRNLDKGVADEPTFDWSEVFPDLLRICKGSFYIWCGTEQVSEIRGSFSDRKITSRLCIWEKSNPSPMNGQHVWLSSVECCVFAKKPRAVFNEHCKSPVWRMPVPRGKLHPTMKPLTLMENLIRVSSNPGDTVLDFCMGSGTTGLAAINTNRKFIGIELNEEYYEVAKNRLTV